MLASKLKPYTYLTAAFIVATLSLFSGQGSAVAATEFDKIDQLLDLKFKKKSQDIDDVYRAYQKAINNAFLGATKRIEVEWPDQVKLPNRKAWVGYTPDLKTRTIIDFANGKMIVESKINQNNIRQAKENALSLVKSVVHKDKKTIDKLDVLASEIKKELGEQQEETIAQTSQATNVLADIIPAITTSDVSQTNKLIDTTADIAPLPDKNKHDFARAIESTQLKTTRLNETLKQTKDFPDSVKDENESPISGTAFIDRTVNENAVGEQTEPATKDVIKLVVNDVKIDDKKLTSQPPVALKKSLKSNSTFEIIELAGQSILRLSIDFVNDYQKVLLEHNYEDVILYAREYQVPISIVLAIIETESSFNPRAVSKVPAFGLMQLVPQTAGTDAHLYIHGENKVVSPDFLFNESNNIQFGAAYFNLLQTRYLRKIKDPLARLYCAVASYNTGVGNLAMTFSGKKNITKASKIINSMTAEQVYQYLLMNLPALETRNYLKKIVTRKLKYEHLDS